MSEPVDPKTLPDRYIPHRVIHDGATYIALDGTDDVLKISIIPSKVTVKIKDGKPFIHTNGEPAYGLKNTLSIVRLTKEEWVVEKRVKLGMGGGE